MIKIANKKLLAGQKNKMLGLRIMNARKEAGFNQDNLSLKIGIHKVSLSRIEKGKSGVAMDTIKKISEITGKPISYFFGEEKIVYVQQQAPQFNLKESQNYYNSLPESELRNLIKIESERIRKMDTIIKRLEKDIKELQKYGKGR